MAVREEGAQTPTQSQLNNIMNNGQTVPDNNAAQAHTNLLQALNLLTGTGDHSGFLSGRRGSLDAAAAAIAEQVEEITRNMAPAAQRAGFSFATHAMDMSSTQLDYGAVVLTGTFRIDARKSVTVAHIFAIEETGPAAQVVDVNVVDLNGANATVRSVRTPDMSLHRIEYYSEVTNRLIAILPGTDVKLITSSVISMDRHGKPMKWDSPEMVWEVISVPLSTVVSHLGYAIAGEIAAQSAGAKPGENHVAIAAAASANVTATNFAKQLKSNQLAIRRDIGQDKTPDRIPPAHKAIVTISSNIAQARRTNGIIPVNNRSVQQDQVQALVNPNLRRLQTRNNALMGMMPGMMPGMMGQMQMQPGHEAILEITSIRSQITRDPAAIMMAIMAVASLATDNTWQRLYMPGPGDKAHVGYLNIVSKMLATGQDEAGNPVYGEIKSEMIGRDIINALIYPPTVAVHVPICDVDTAQYEFLRSAASGDPDSIRIIYEVMHFLSNGAFTQMGYNGPIFEPALPSHILFNGIYGTTKGEQDLRALTNLEMLYALRAAPMQMDLYDGTFETPQLSAEQALALRMQFIDMATSESAVYTGRSNILYFNRDFLATAVRSMGALPVTSQMAAGQNNIMYAPRPDAVNPLAALNNVFVPVSSGVTAPIAQMHNLFNTGSWINRQ